eukprot:ctg_7334.g498
MGIAGRRGIGAGQGTKVHQAATKPEQYGRQGRGAGTNNLGVWHFDVPEIAVTLPDLGDKQ